MFFFLKPNISIILAINFTHSWLEQAKSFAIIHWRLSLSMNFEILSFVSLAFSFFFFFFFLESLFLLIRYVDCLNIGWLEIFVSPVCETNNMLIVFPAGGKTPALEKERPDMTLNRILGSSSRNLVWIYLSISFYSYQSIYVPHIWSFSFRYDHLWSWVGSVKTFLLNFLKTGESVIVTQRGFHAHFMLWHYDALPGRIFNQ